MERLAWIEVVLVALWLLACVLMLTDKGGNDRDTGFYETGVAVTTGFVAAFGLLLALAVLV